MINRTQVVLLLVLVSGIWPSHLLATATYQDGYLTLPYLEYENQLYSVEMALVSSSLEIDFVVSGYSILTDDAAPAANIALYAGGVLSIPALRVGIETYQVQLDYLESEGVWRLLDAPAALMASTAGVLCGYSDSTSNNQASLTITSISDWRCSDGLRTLEANGIPDHEVGTFPNPANPNTICGVPSRTYGNGSHNATWWTDWFCRIRTEWREDRPRHCRHL